MRAIRNFLRTRPLSDEGIPYPRSVLGSLAWFCAWVVISVVGVVSAAGGSLYAHHYFTYEVPKSQVVVTVANDPQACTPQFPLLVSVLNGSSRVIVRTWVYVSAHIPNRSTDYAKFESLDSDRIIPPGEEWRQCWSAQLNSYATGGTQVDRGALVWSLGSYRVAFQ
jgi:hypothetical protein